MLHISVTDIKGGTFTLSDIKGSIILQQAIIEGENKINMQELAKGIYFLRIESGTDIQYQKIIKE